MSEPLAVSPFAAPPAAEFESTCATPATRRSAQRFGFFFVATYLLIYYLPAPLSWIPHLEFLDGLPQRLWSAVVPAVWRHLFGQSAPLKWQQDGGGDKTVHWLEMLCTVLLAALLAAVWTWIDRRARSDRWCRAGMRIYVRYTLAAILLEYGLSKVIKTQFPAPPLARLEERYSDASPMGLLWTFMGYSPLYNLFSGAVECAAALLFFRATTTLGALLSVAAMSNVLLLNLCYDVPVKLGAAHLLLMGFFLLAPETRRLLALLSNRAAPAALDAPLPLKERVPRVARALLKTLFIGFIVVSIAQQRLATLRGFEARAKHNGGLLSRPFLVDEFWRNGHRITDTSRWQTVVLGGRELTAFVPAVQDDVSYPLGPVTARTPTLNLFSADRSRPVGALTFSQVDAIHLVMNGVVAGARLGISMHASNRELYPLMRESPHWIDDRPAQR